MLREPMGSISEVLIVLYVQSLMERLTDPATLDLSSVRPLRLAFAAIHRPRHLILTATDTKVNLLLHLALP